MRGGGALGGRGAGQVNPRARGVGGRARGRGRGGRQDQVN